MGIEFHRGERITAGSMITFMIGANNGSEYISINGVVKWIRRRGEKLFCGFGLADTLSKIRCANLIHSIS